MSRVSSDAFVDLEKGATGAKASSDASVDLEKGATGVKAAATATEEEEQLAVVDRPAMDPRLAMCIKVTLDVWAVLYVFYYIGMTTFMVRHDKWDSWPAVLIQSTVLIWAIWMAPKMKYDTKPTRGSDGSDLSTGLIAYKK